MEILYNIIIHQFVPSVICPFKEVKMKKKILAMLTAIMVAAGMFTTPVQTLLGSETISAAAATTVSAPKASKKSGNYYAAASLKITLSSATSGASIYYSVNGAAYKKYTGAFSITKNSTVKAYAKYGTTKSAVATYTYKLCPKVIFSLPAGTYDGAQTVTLSSTASNVKFYYTLDGTKPTRASTLYTASGIKLTKSCQLRVLATKTGWSGCYFTKNYTINNAAQTADELSILDDYTGKWGYSTLNAAQKKAYAKLFEAVASYSQTADVSNTGLTKNDVNELYWAFDYDNPQFFWLGNQYKYSYYSTGKVISLTMTYGRTASQKAAIQPKFEAAAQEIIDKALEYSDPYDRLMVLHDELALRTEYLTSGGAHISEADGPLVYGEALCEGYSKAFMYLCQSIGIECVCIIGGEHMWNIVKVDGEWYHIDVTWDDPIVTGSSGGSNITHKYFLVSDKTVLLDHEIENFFTIPTAAKDYVRS